MFIACFNIVKFTANIIQYAYLVSTSMLIKVITCIKKLSVICFLIPTHDFVHKIYVFLHSQPLHPTLSLRRIALLLDLSTEFVLQFIAWMQ